MKHEIIGIFPVHVYRTSREADLDSIEKKEIEAVIDEGMTINHGNSYTNNTYIFDTILYNLKEFCQQHIKNYVDEIINPTDKTIKEELDFYITQAWINVTKPGEFHQTHTHGNSIISGSFYIQTDVGQTITCYNTHQNQRNAVNVITAGLQNSSGFRFNVTNNQLLLFPSWLDHGVTPNEKQTIDVISLSFNTFVRGNLGQRENLNHLILQ